MTRQPRRCPRTLGPTLLATLGALALAGCNRLLGIEGLRTGTDTDGQVADGQIADGQVADALVADARPIDAAGDAGADANLDANCIAYPVLPVITRDFRSTHPDFQAYLAVVATPGLVENHLGADRKPVYAPTGGTAVTTGKVEFDQWYRDVPDTNIAIPTSMPLTLVNGFTGFDAPSYFPINDQGFGNENPPYNYSFTTEIHTRFRYRGGEKVTFDGDDDFWLFINGRLAIDLGGVHREQLGTVDLDGNATTLGLTVGEDYPLEIFHAERHTSESHFVLSTSIKCFLPQ